MTYAVYKIDYQQRLYRIVYDDIQMYAPVIILQVKTGINNDMSEYKRARYIIF